VERIKPLLQTTFRDVRVTNHTPEKVFVMTSNIAVAFAVDLSRRFERFVQFVSKDLTLRRVHEKVNYYQRFSRFHINVMPHLEMSSRLEKTYRIIERNESRIHTVSGPYKSEPSVQRILKRLEFQGISNQRRSGPEAVKGTPRQSFEPEIRPLRPKAFTTVEMVTQQPRRSISIPPEPERNFERRQPLIDHRPIEPSPRSTPNTDVINIKQLTDQVVEVLDRRLIANHERLTRR
jgi:hypothetical protein